MSVSNEFKKIVSDETLLNVKVMLKQYALLDKSLSKFNDALNYAYEILGKELIVKHDGEAFNNNRDDWNEEYAMGIASDLVFNFSQERIDHLREVFKKVYPNAKPYEEVSSSHKTSNGPNTGKVVGVKIKSERIIEKDSNPADGKGKANTNNSKNEKVRKKPGSVRRAETIGSKFEKNASKAAGAVLVAGGAVAAVAGLAAGSTGVAVAGAVAATAGVVVTVASSNKKD